MKLATLKDGTRDGRLVVVDDALERCTQATGIAVTLQAALDDWAKAAPALKALADRLNAGDVRCAEPFSGTICDSPLPRAYQFADGSAFLNHMELLRKARGAEMPESLWTDPLMYQGLSDGFLGPCDDIALADESWGIDFEAEIAVITDDVPMGVTPDQAGAHIKLVMLCNDVSLRNLVPGEVGKGFGFFQSKPASAFSPVAITPDALGDAWDGTRLHLPLRSFVNDTDIGRPNGGTDMTFGFDDLIAHAARTRRLGAGTIVGSGTVSNKDRAAGSSCLAEIRMIETLEHGEPRTPFLKHDDRVRIEMQDKDGASLFGAIDQRVVTA